MRKIRDRLQYWAFVSPALIIVVCICIIPLFINSYYALFDWNGISSTKKFVGFSNFIHLMTSDPKYLRAVSFTVRYTLFYVVITNVIALSIAVVLTGSSRRVSNIGRACYYIPCICAPTAIGLLWKCIFRDGTKTLYDLTHLEIFARSWIGSVDLSFWSILIVGIWCGVGFYNIIYITALLSVPEDIVEAAKIDGANSWQRFWRIKFPQIIPTFSTVILLSLINGFKVFDAIMLITEGGPAGMSTSMAYSIYRSAFHEHAYGMS